MEAPDHIRKRTGRRDVAIGFAVTFVLANAVLFLFVWGDRTLQNGASSVSSLFASGAAYPDPTPILTRRESDPYAGALQAEPEFALEHALVIGDHVPPLWNPFSAYGAPLAANMQSQPYSPLAWIPILWPDARGYDLFLVIRIWLAGFLAFLFLRSFCAPLAALAGGIAYMLSGYLWLFLTAPQLSVEVLTPGLLLGVECALRRPSRASTIGFGVALALSIVGGMPESTTLAGMFAFAYACARIAGDRDVRRVAGRSCVSLAAGAVLGCALGGIAVVPFLEYLGASSSEHWSGDPLLASLRIPDSFSMRALALYLAPLAVGPPGAATLPGGAGLPALRGSFGAAGAFFSLVSLFAGLEDAWRARPREPAPVFTFSTVAVLLLSNRFGAPLVDWIGSLPVLRQIVLAKYEEGIVACCVAFLVGFGVSRLSERRVSMPALLLSLGIPFTILVTAGFDRTNSLDCALLVLVACGVLGIVSLRGAGLSPRSLALAACVIVAAELPCSYIVPLFYLDNPLPAQSESPLLGAPYIGFLQAHLKDGERFYGQDWILTPNWSAAFGIPDERAVDALYPSRYLQFARALMPGNAFELRSFFTGGVAADFGTTLPRRFLALSSVRYVGSLEALVPGSPASSFPFRRAFDSPGASIYEFTSPLPRISVYLRVVRAADAADALRILGEPRWNPRLEAIVEGPSPDLPALERGPRTGVLGGRLESYASQYVRAAIDAPGPALVVLNDTNFPGWTASVDGRDVPILAANFLFRGIAVPRGKHVVEFRYRPRSFLAGSVISGTALVLIAGLTLFGRCRKRITAGA